MDWDVPLVMTRSFAVQLLGFEAYAAKASFSSREAISLDGVTLALVSAFTTPTSPRDAMAVHATRWTIDEEAYATTLGQLIAVGVIGPVEDAAPVQTSDYAHVLAHHPMLQDTVRLDAYRGAIERNVAGKRVVEIGCGTGVLSMFAARGGAAHVTAIEETAVITLAAELISANGLGETVELVSGNSLDVTLSEPADVLIHELIGHEPLAENAVRFLADAKRRLVRPGGRMIPDVIEVRARAVERIGWSDPAARLAEADELALRYGLDLGPYRAKLAEVPKLPMFAMRLDAVRTGARTRDAVVHRADFSADEPVVLPPTTDVELEVTRGGSLTSVALWFRARMDEHAWLTNAPEAALTHWALAIYDFAEPRRVSAGEVVTLRARVESQDGLERTMVELV